MIFVVTKSIVSNVILASELRGLTAGEDTDGWGGVSDDTGGDVSAESEYYDSDFHFDGSFGCF